MADKLIKLNEYAEIDVLFGEELPSGEKLVEEILKTHGCNGISCLENFRKIFLSVGSSGSYNSTITRLKNGERALSREKIIMLAFALGCNEPETDSLLSAYGYEGLHARFYEDAIYLFFLKYNSMEDCVNQYQKAHNMIKEFEPVFSCPKDIDEPLSDEREGGNFAGDCGIISSNENAFTECCYNAISEFETEEELKKYLSDDTAKAHMGKITKTVKYYYYKSLNIVLADLIEKTNEKIGAELYMVASERNVDKLTNIDDASINQKRMDILDKINIEDLLKKNSIKKQFDFYLNVLPAYLKHPAFKKTYPELKLDKCTTLFELMLLCKHIYFDEQGDSNIGELWLERGMFSQESIEEYLAEEIDDYRSAYGGRYALWAKGYTISRDMLIFVTFMKEYIERLKPPKTESYKIAINRVLQHCYMDNLKESRHMDRYILEILKSEPQKQKRK